MQYQKANIHKKYYIKLLFLLSILFFSFLCCLNESKADSYFDSLGFEYEIEGPPTPSAMQILVADIKHKAETVKGFFKGLAQAIIEADRRIDEIFKGRMGAKAYRAALKYFLNQIAYDTAVYLATGEKGQGPMFESRNAGEYIMNVADNAAGSFINAVTSDIFNSKFNLCKPDLNIKLRIGLGLKDIKKPTPPSCSFREMKKNWENELNSKDFLTRFEDIFNPTSNDLGIALSLQTGIMEEKQKQINQSIIDYIKDAGFKPVTDPISGRVKTPANIVRRLAEKQVEDSTKLQTTPTGDYLGDALDIFVNTLFSKLFDKWLKKGLVDDKSDYAYDWSKINQFDAPGGGGGIKAAKERMRSLGEMTFDTRADYDITLDLTKCDNPDKAGPSDCVITDKFRQAVIKQLTVGEAIDQGYLDPKGVFGFISGSQSGDLEPSYQEGYPYRSMIILRKYRILPVGWEAAAEDIKVNKRKTFTLGEMVACFAEDDKYQGMEGETNKWCRNYVDPDWVLKAPANYCARMGFGPEISLSRVEGEGNESRLLISRQEDYCADEQSCIKEGSDGTCEFTGYCTEERRTWRMDAETCEPVYNTCLGFQAEDGRRDFYLQNTLDYADCSADNVGCTGYCQPDTQGKFSCTAADPAGKIFLDKTAGECAADALGCHEYIRTKSGLGVNLVRNGSFEKNVSAEDWTFIPKNGGADGKLELDATQSFLGAQSLKITAHNNNLNDPSHAAQTVYGLMKNEIITVSYYVKYDGQVSPHQGAWLVAYLRDENNQPVNYKNQPSGWIEETLVNFSGDGQWKKVSFSFSPQDDSDPNSLEFTLVIEPRLQVDAAGRDISAWFDGIKVEKNANATDYSEYRENGLVYLSNAQTCASEQVGCQMLTQNKNLITVPAKIALDDYCPAECDGYDSYLARPTQFDSERVDNLIPALAAKCGAGEVGCDQFTNLDAAARGGESVANYSFLRRCNKPGNANVNCGDYYTWEGSNETGYQLKNFRLSENTSGTIQPQMLDGYNPDSCTPGIYKLPAADPAYNPDCREFYNKAGEVFYRLFSQTITCSDDCVPFRRSLNNIITSSQCQSECAGVYDPTQCQSGCDSISCKNSAADGQQSCFYELQGTEKYSIFCKSGGKWSVQHQACIYEAIPSESRTCQASQAGCREYSGSEGNNSRILFTDTFTGIKDDWQGANNTSLELSSESLFVNGQSLSLSNGSPKTAMEKKLGLDVRQGKSYVLSFLAKTATGNLTLSAGIKNYTNQEESFGTANITPAWQVYTLDLPELKMAPDQDTVLRIVADNSGKFYIDDIRLTEITDRYFLIRDSWQIPKDCLSTMLGCAGYTDADGASYYLYKFSQLCPESTVGCEAMIDTYNFTPYGGKTWPNYNPAVSVATDTPVYVAYDPRQQCNCADKGCSLLGRPHYYDGEVVYTPAYVLNNPDLYDQALCNMTDDGCRQYNTNDGLAYLKDPGDQLCEWKLKTNTSSSTAWLKIPVKKCCGIGAGKYCLSDSDCVTGVKCEYDEGEYECPVSEIKTIGIGGGVKQPDQQAGVYWVGLCPAGQDTCTEYIDPLSRPSVNLFNSTNKSAFLKPKILYVIKNFPIVHTINNVLISIDPDLYVLNQKNILEKPTSVSPSNHTQLIFLNNGTGKLLNDLLEESEIRQAMITYNLAKNVDRSTCNGLVNFEDGCLLFNERAADGKGYKELVFDADATIDDNVGVTPKSGNKKNANALIKVRPDRVCNEWLACNSYIQDKQGNQVCYGIGLCDSLDDKGDCNSFAAAPKANQIINSSTIKQYGNSSGYLQAGEMTYKQLYPVAAMKEAGEFAEVPNGSFEYYDSQGYPIGWNAVDQTRQSVVWESNKFSVINNPIAAQIYDVKYPIDGKAILRLAPSGVTMQSDFIDVEPNSTYVLSAYINTKQIQKPLDASLNIGISPSTYDYAGTTVKQQGGGADISLCDQRTKPWINGCGVSLPAGNDWTLINSTFQLGPDTTRLKINFNAQIYPFGVSCCIGSEWEPMGSADSRRQINKSDGINSVYYFINQWFAGGWFGSGKNSYYLDTNDNWAEVSGFGTDMFISSFAAYNNKLYAAGGKKVGTLGRQIAVFNTNKWDPLIISSSDFPNLPVYKLKNINNNLYAVGGSDSEGFVMKYDGANWTKIGTNLDGSVYDIIFHNNTLYIAASSSQVVAKLESGQWEPVINSGKFDGTALALEIYDNKLIVGGYFTKFGETVLNGIAQLDGNQWQPMGKGFTFANSQNSPGVEALMVVNLDDDEYEEDILFAAGSFDRANGGWAPNIARWYGHSWLGTQGSFSKIKTLASDPGAKPKYIVAAGLPTNSYNIAKWKKSNSEDDDKCEKTGNREVAPSYSCMQRGEAVLGGYDRCYTIKKKAKGSSVYGSLSLIDENVYIASADACTGNVFVDNIQLRPALNKRFARASNIPGQMEMENKILPTCRLYPAQDALSCSYYEDSGKYQKGLLGYCLEYDRKPGSEDNCLLWYPTGKVKGDGIEEGGGYLGKMPVYYCLDFAECELIEPRKSIWASGSCNCRPTGEKDSFLVKVCDQNGSCQEKDVAPPGYFAQNTGNQAGCGHDCPRHSNPGQNHRWNATPVSSDFVGRYNNIDWYKYNGSLIELVGTPDSNESFNEGDYGLKAYCPDLDGLIIDVDFPLPQELLNTPSNDGKYKIPYCKKIVQTVNAVGQNKYWSGRVYNGSDYHSTCNEPFSNVLPMDCYYSSDYIPFGSIVQPNSGFFSNPYDWDSRPAKDGVQPLFYESPEKSLSAPYQPRMGQIFSIDWLKRIFAKSYGIWSWQGEKNEVSNVDEKKITFSANTTLSEFETIYCPAGYLGQGTCIMCDPMKSQDGSISEIKEEVTGKLIGCKANLTKKTQTDPITGISEDYYGPVCMQLDCKRSQITYTNFNFQYRLQNVGNWSPPDKKCAYTINNQIARPPYDPNAPEGQQCNKGDCLNCTPNTTGDLPSSCDYCAVPPVISNIQVNPKTISKGNFVNLTFNSQLDSQQLPLVMYAVDWGDGATTSVSGVEMNARPNTNDPHSLFHYYDFSQACTAPGVSLCTIKPKIKIKDNWGWCNGGTTIYDCDSWASDPTITINK